MLEGKFSSDLLVVHIGVSDGPLSRLGNCRVGIGLDDFSLSYSDDYLGGHVWFSAGISMTGHAFVGH